MVVSDLGDLVDLTRDWDDDKASALAAAYTAHVAALHHGHDYSPYEFSSDGFDDTSDRIEELIQLEQRLGEEEFDAATEDQQGHYFLVEHACRFPGEYY